jgi:hypothetical protein
MFRIGIAFATTVLSLSMIATTIGNSLAQGNQRKIAPAVRSAPVARPAQVARPSQAARPAQAVPRSRVQSAPVVHPTLSPRVTATRRAPQIAAPPRRAPPRIATPPARTAPVIRRATRAPNRIGGSPAEERRGFTIRDASRATIAGRNFSVWHDSHRVRRGGHWRTLVALSTLAIITFGSAPYYPYAYIDVPTPYCRGLTEDGCRLQWQEVPTLEGPTVYECVAYCPRQ